MFANKISDSIYYVGVNDRKSRFFERMIPIPYGVTYNSYLMIDDKVTLFDTVDITFAENSIHKINNVLQGKKINYLVIHHLEPDHTSGIMQYLAAYPDMTILCSKKASEMLHGFYGLTANIQEVADGEELSTGKHSIKFFYTPMVHWPEVMMSYEITDKILFSADAFGSFRTLDGSVIDDTLNIDKYLSEAERYYVNIVGKYGNPVQNTLKKIAKYDIDTICSLHGPVWRTHKDKIMEIYDRLSSHEAKSGVVIVYGSMYAHTEAMAEAIAAGAHSVTNNVIMHDVSNIDSSEIITDIFTYKGLAIGSPTYNGSLFPKVQEVLDKIVLRGLKNRVFASFGSFTWAGQAVRLLNKFAEDMKYENIGSVEVKHAMSGDEYEHFYKLGKELALKAS